MALHMLGPCTEPVYNDSGITLHSILSLRSGLGSRAEEGKVEAVDTRPSGLERTVSGQKVGVDVQVLRRYIMVVIMGLVLNTMIKA